MDERLSPVPETFTELVRDALLHLYQPAGLHGHALLALAGEALAGEAAPGQWLRRSLLDAIAAVQPEPGVASSARAWRIHRILELRYLEGHDVASIIEQIALSKSQYHREHHRALETVAALLWERWRVAERWSTPATDPARATEREAARHAAEQLLPGSPPRPVDLLAVIAGLGEILRPLCTRRNVTLQLPAPLALPPVLGERVALRQALLAVLAPAVATAIDSTITVEVADGDRQIDLRLRGVVAGPLTAIERGVQESRPFVDGLRGTVVYSPAADGAWGVHLALPRGDRPALLVVDNNADFIRLVERFLASHPWEVIAASTVEHAHARARAHHPAAILLDVVIPDRDGWDLLLALKTTPETRDIPVIICSVLNEPEVATSLGATAYLHKPISQQQLTALLERLG
jgi:CheY-like chemotaxis protein